MKCTKCHFENTEDSFFCKKCGTKLPLSDGALYSQTKTIQGSPAILEEGSLETIQKAVSELLGTPAEHKQRILYETDHILPLNEYVKETLAWPDKHLGPVK